MDAVSPLFLIGVYSKPISFFKSLFPSCIVPSVRLRNLVYHSTHVADISFLSSESC